MTKLNLQQIEQIRKLRKEGTSQLRIAKIYDISLTAVQYWTDEKNKQKKIEYARAYFQKMSPEEKKARNEKNKPYRRAYAKKKYHNNEAFREKVIAANLKWRMKKALQLQSPT
jgi:hypothetical protein